MTPRMREYLLAQPAAFPARVFAPIYRAATFSGRKLNWDSAYLDVSAAFRTFLDAARRPIFVAGHSQGAVHALRLLRDFDLGDRLVGAYCPGTATADHPGPFAPEVGGVALWNCVLDDCLLEDTLVGKFATAPPLVRLGGRELCVGPVYGWRPEDGSPVLYDDCYARRSVQGGFLRFYAATERHRNILPHFAPHHDRKGDAHAFDFHLVWGDVRVLARSQLEARRIGAIGAGAAAAAIATYCVVCLGERGIEHSPAQLGVAFLGIVVVAAWAAMETLEDAENVATFRSGAEFFAILFLVYACDRTDLFEKAPKIQDRTAFWSAWALACAVGLATVAPTKPRILARDQTEEWKGWMQLMFLLYHYFVEVELYNAIRVYIAAYVWMTGYGNFLYYQKTGNFGVVRVAQTLFRLNFLAFFACALLRNEYMLYYICPMHTLFTLLVWASLRIRTSVNATNKVVLKIILTLGATSLVYDTPLFGWVFGWCPILQFHDPLHPRFEPTHEWRFRSGLDRYVWVWGMACAAGLPLMERVFDASFGGKLAVAAVAGIAFGVWVAYVFRNDKYAYNALHPYTSFVPLTCFVVFRNLFPKLRGSYLRFFAALGKITLETYILQFHVWMKTTGLNGSPKFLLQLLPRSAAGESGAQDALDLAYFANFLAVTAIYLYISHRVFHITADLKDALIPTEPNKLYKAIALAFFAALFFYAAGYLAKKFLLSGGLLGPPPAGQSSS
ncbi:hypothetical protein CTAYLR_003190 [Chrysophaeum taylorii]|uniref:Cas1p 10 TM acyl transferase domain-containing protein n=1 Tax=Chrysophaeum taylorii TaxID=2483200 RepID=A0AAD7UB74_9STRA|nr:hypothetical protein CTAYLR_003190 [Chrysophaeum taylorii]